MPRNEIIGEELSKTTLDPDNRWLRRSLQTLRPFLLPALVFAFALLSRACNSSTSARSRPLTPEEQRGRDLFFTNCAICHNAYKKEPLQGPPLVGMFRKQDLPSGIPATDQHVHDTILLGRRNMPPFNGILDDKQVEELIAFLHTL